MDYLVTALLLVLPFSSVYAQTNHAVLSAVAVLTIHVSDTNTHEGVFRLLTDVLKLPVDYGPETHGERRYAAVYAGNMFIEPCGPFSNMKYPTKNFKALFFGLNCVSALSASSIAAHLDRLSLVHEKAGPKMFRVQEASVAEGIYLAIDTQPPKKAAMEREALLGSALAANQRDGLGLECIQEVWMGYTEAAELQAWSRFLGASGKVNSTLWHLERNQSLRFVKSEFRGVRGILCKVHSVEKARQYVDQAQCSTRLADGRIELDKSKTFGLTICLAEN